MGFCLQFTFDGGQFDGYIAVMGSELEHKGIQATVNCDTDRIITAVQRTREKFGHGCAVLLGAGCSATAKIPVAATFVQWIKSEFPPEYASACKVCISRNRPEPNYFDCMEELPDGDQADLIRRGMKEARMNWAHIALAQLMQTGSIDRVLTTNFDPLIVKACALLNHFPAVYDIAASSDFVPSAVADSAVFYLHGQSTGWRLLNRLDDSHELTDRIRAVVKEVIDDRPLIVVGYNGAEDPVCRALFELRSYRRGLYWIGYKDEPPDKYVIDHILKREKSARFQSSPGADSFFVTLARKLSSFPPSFVEAPFTHLMDLFSKIENFTEDKSDVDFLEQTRKWIIDAITRFEKGEEDPSQTRASLQNDKLSAESLNLLAAGKFDEVITVLTKKIERELSNSEKKTLAVAYDARAEFKFYRMMQETLAEKRIALLEEAEQDCREATKLNPEDSMAFNNWGLILTHLARQTSGTQSDQYSQNARDKYEQALVCQPANYDALCNLGLALLDASGRKTGEEQAVMLRQALDKLSEALKIRPNGAEALAYSGSVLVAQADLEPSRDKQELIRKSAYRKFELALTARPDYFDLLIVWANALCQHAFLKSNDDADKLWQLGYAKYQRAVELRPASHQPLTSWGAALLFQSRSKQGTEQTELLNEAERVLLKGERMHRGSCSYNLACVAARRRNVGGTLDWLTASKYAGSLPAKAYIMQDPDFELIRDDPKFKEFLDSMPDDKTD